MATQVRLNSTSGDSNDLYFFDENWFKEENQNEGVDLTRLVISNAMKKVKKIKSIEIRFRDSALGWGAWEKYLFRK